MRTNLWRMASFLTLLAMLISPIGFSGSASAAPVENHTASGSMPTGMKLVEAAHVGVSQPLEALAANKAASAEEAPSYLKQNPERLVLPKSLNGAADIQNAPAIEDAPVANNMPATEANFEGVNNVSGVLPPDTDGDIGYDPITGKKYYLQWVNLALQIWDVTNPAAPVAQLASPVAGNTLWTGAGGICEANNDGDPITLYDHIANRWMISQFALSFPDNFHQCIAVSASGDPTGSWYLYDFQTSATVMNDYPKFGVWPDGYYMSVNQFDGTTESWAGAGVAVFERAQMLQGLPARMIYVNVGDVTLDYGGMLPSDLDGPASAYGTPNYFMEWDDSTWLSDTSDTLRIWEFKVDWTTPANTTFGANSSFDPNLMLSTTDATPLCSGTRNCIDQPDTTQNLDAIADRLMFRLQYRDFGAYQTLVANHTVDAGSGRAGIHWFELRDTGSGWSIYQDDIYAPADTENRWMGSIAMDDNGNIALGYSVSSGTIYPSIRYSGRLSSDPLNDLPQGEAVMIAGGGAQTHSAARWGDYSKMSVDPEDGCTFWYTQEYMQTTSSSGWQTRIGSFRFPSCTALPTGTLSGTVTDGVNPLAGVSIDVDGTYHTVTDASGNYSLELIDGTYSVVASKYGYTTSTAPSVVITSPNITDQDFTLAAAATHTISGTVTDSVGGWPLYARIDIAGYPGAPIFTNPVTGLYSISLVDGPYTFAVTPLSGGYNPFSTPIVVSADATHNFALDVDSAACAAPGYQTIPGTLLFSDGFDTSTYPAFSSDWAKVNVSGTAGDWVTSIVGQHPSGTAVHSAPNMAVFNSYTATSGNSTRLYRTTGYDLSGQTSGEVSFWMYHDTVYTDNDTVQVQISTDGGTTWNNAGAPVSRYDGSTMWKQHTVNINAYTGAGMTDVRVAFLALSQWGSDTHIDDMSVNTETKCLPIANDGLIVGNVYDANTNLPLANADVVDAGMKHVLFVNNSADPAEDAPLYIIAEPAGSVSLTASALMYGNDTKTPAAVAGASVRQDFALAAGMLSVSPASLTFNVTTAAPTANQPASVSNTGGLAAGMEIFAVPGTFAGYTPTGPFAANTRHLGPKNLNDTNSSALRILPTRPSIPPLAAGTVNSSWNTGLTYAWGLGYNTDANDMWLGNLGAAGGDDLDYRFTTAGTNTGDTIDTAPWVGSYAADMTYNPFTNKLWQVNVGGDNCIYEMDPATMSSTGNKMCPAFGTSQRGLAFDPQTNTYYSGSWNDFVINHFAPDGTLLDSMNVNLEIAGLAFNPVTRHLFVFSNTDSASTPTNYDITVLDVANSYAVIGGFNIGGTTTVLTDYAQAGLEIDCAGNLWAVDQDAQKVYSVASGETGVCDWQASWLTVTPSTGSVSASGNTALTVSANATSMAAGTYNAYLRVTNSTPYGDKILPVTLNVTASPIFADVPLTHWAGSWIERLYLNGITGGCGTNPLTYCPGVTVTRDQMAVFLLRGIHGSSYTPPAVGGTTGFNDVPTTHWAAAWIKELAAEGITGGCGNGNFCPGAPVTRDQMAVFLLRGEHGSSYSPPSASGAMFGDIPSTFWAAAWIEQLANEGITSGCGNGNYCPATPVTRDQMAVFLVRAFNLP